MTLAIEEKNSIFRAVDDAGLDPTEFEGPVDAKGEIHFTHQLPAHTSTWDAANGTRKRGGSSST